VKDQFFYTVPSDLLQSICRPQTGEAFEVDEELLQLEADLSRISGDHGSRVGFWNAMPIQCNIMHTAPSVRREDLAGFGLSEEDIKNTVRQANERLLSFSDITCGYAGWLMTNPEFLSELDALNEQYCEPMHRWGTALVGLPIPSTQPEGLFNPTAEEGWKEYDAAVLEFCVRWRLQGLAGPRIPVPMRPMMSGQFPLSIVEQLMRAGGLFNWPDTFPLFARDELRDLLADALRQAGTNEHLSGWQSIIDSSNRAKNQFGSFERRFRLQHFWRLLRQRHPAAFNRRLSRIELAFAPHLGVDESSIKRDRQEIQKRLGRNWDQN